MRTDIYLIISFDIKSDDADGLASVVQTMTELSRAEDGCLAYEFGTNADRTKAHMIEHFKTSEALIDHINHGASKHSEVWNRHLSLSSFVVFGEPSAELRAMLPPDATYTDRVNGFTK